MAAKSVLISKDYDGNFEISFPDYPDLFPDKLHPNDIDSICDDFPDLNKLLTNKISVISKSIRVDKFIDKVRNSLNI